MIGSDELERIARAAMELEFKDIFYNALGSCNECDAQPYSYPYYNHDNTCITGRLEKAIEDYKAETTTKEKRR